MPYSYNGWSASPDLAIRPLVVAGEPFTPGVRDNDDVWTVLRYVAEQMHARVEPIVRSDWHQADDWGFNYRPTTNDTSLSCHASGTAIDYNATRHPYGVPTSANFTPAQITEVHKILDELDGAVIWGGDWNTADAMHFEISTGSAHLAVVAARIRAKYEEEAMPTPKEIAEAVWGREITPIKGGDPINAGRMLAQTHNRADDVAALSRILADVDTLLEQTKDVATREQARKIRADIAALTPGE